MLADTLFRSAQFVSEKEIVEGSIVTLEDTSDSKNVDRFEMMCDELSNRNSRMIMKSLASRPLTCSEISQLTGFTVQCVWKHISRLTSLAIVESDRNATDVLRGRKGRRFRLAKFPRSFEPWTS